ncbi:MAG: CoA transferase [Pseudomonadota bacterium]
MTDAVSPGPLKGLRVLELAHVMAGPTCGRLLADFGAEVIKLERPGGEDSRRMAPPWQGAESAAFLMLNRNKRGVVLDLKSEAGKALFLELLDTVDVLVENFRKGTMERLGLGYETLRARNPGLIYCEISGFGRTGPKADEGGFDVVAQAISGIMSVTGEAPGRPPVKAGVPITDVGAGMLGAMGVLAAYIHRMQTGQGQRVDTSLLEAGALFMMWPAASYFADATVAQPMGSAHPLDAPYQAFAARDGWLIVGAANQSTWERLLAALGRPELGADERYCDNPARVRNLDALIAELTPLFAVEPVAHWLSLLQAHGVPCGPINNVADMAHDAQLKARGMVNAVPHSDLGSVATLGCPVQFSETPATLRRGAPTLGEHTEGVLGELGYDRSQLAAFRAAGAFGPDPEPDDC